MQDKEINKIRLFIPGPTNVSDETLRIGSIQYGYFRDDDFTRLNLENEKNFLDFTGCKNGRVIPLTCSGTGAMEAILVNVVKKDDNILVINGGPFAERWYKMCRFFKYEKMHNLDIGFGRDIDTKILEDAIKNNDIDTILCQSNETPSGQLYDIEAIGELSKKHGCTLIVDAIGSLFADDFRMDEWNVDVSLVSTQKGLRLPSGMAYVIINRRAIKLLTNPRSFYFNFNLYLEDYQLGRGHTPFTPNVTLIHQVNQKLREIKKMGIASQIEEMHDKAVFFRELCKDMPLTPIAQTPSNLETGYVINNIEKYDATELYEYLKKKNIYIWRSGKQMKRWLDNPVRRHIIISHNGCSKEDHKDLVEHMKRYFK